MVPSAGSSLPMVTFDHKTASKQKKPPVIGVFAVTRGFP
jgi:hypothetical protein